MYPHAVAYFHFAPNCDIGLFDLYSLMIESNSIINFYWFHSEKNYAINLPIPIYQVPILLRERGGGGFIWINHEHFNSTGKIKNKHVTFTACLAFWVVFLCYFSEECRFLILIMKDNSVSLIANTWRDTILLIY